MKIRRMLFTLLALLMTACAVVSPSIAAHADTKGSLSIRVHSGEINVPNAKIELFHIGDFAGEHTEYSFTLEAKFASSGIAIDEFADIVDASTLQAFLSFIAENTISPDITEITSADGTCNFPDLEPGLYLLRQNGTDGRAEFNAMNPFILSVPIQEDGELVYDIDAAPKVDPLPTPTATPRPSPTASPRPTVTPRPTYRPYFPYYPGGGGGGGGGSSAGTLPQTGLLLWPVLLLAFGGVLIFCIGWSLVFRNRGDRDA